MCRQRCRRNSQRTRRTCVGHGGRRRKTRSRCNRGRHPSLHRPAAHCWDCRCRRAARRGWALRRLLDPAGNRRPRRRLQMCRQWSRGSSQRTRRTCAGHGGRRSKTRLQAGRAVSCRIGRRARRCSAFGEQIYWPHWLCHALSTAPKLAYLPVYRGELPDRWSQSHAASFQVEDAPAPRFWEPGRGVHYPNPLHSRSCEPLPRAVRSDSSTGLAHTIVALERSSEARAIALESFEGTGFSPCLNVFCCEGHSPPRAEDAGLKISFLMGISHQSGRDRPRKQSLAG